MAKKKPPTIGPRGGVTTITNTGMVRKAIYLHYDEWEALRGKAYEENRPASEIVREALRRMFFIPDPRENK